MSEENDSQALTVSGSGSLPATTSTEVTTVGGRYDCERVVAIRGTSLPIDLIPVYCGLSISADMLEKLEREPERIQRNVHAVAISMNFAVRFAALAGFPVMLSAYEPDTDEEDQEEVYQRRHYRERQLSDPYRRVASTSRQTGYGASGDF